MKNAAPNIQERKTGYIVRLKRQDVTRSFWVRKTTPRALACAMHLRDSAATATPRLRVFRQAKSNTGVVGVSETTFWKRGRGYPCFVVGWNTNGRRKSKRIMYGPTRSRKTALKMAIAIRKENTKC